MVGFEPTIACKRISREPSRFENTYWIFLCQEKNYGVDLITLLYRSFVLEITSLLCGDRYMSLAKAFASVGIVTNEKAIESLNEQQKKKSLFCRLSEYYHHLKPLQLFLSEYEHMAETNRIGQKEKRMILYLKQFYFEIGEPLLSRNVQFHLDRILKKQGWKDPSESQKVIWTIRACGYTLLDVLTDPSPKHYSDYIRQKVLAWLDANSEV